jgi:hypothetical protein
MEFGVVSFIFERYQWLVVGVVFRYRIFHRVIREFIVVGTRLSFIESSDPISDFF